MAFTWYCDYAVTNVFPVSPNLSQIPPGEYDQILSQFCVVVEPFQECSEANATDDLSWIKISLSKNYRVDFTLFLEGLKIDYSPRLT